MSGHDVVVIGASAGGLDPLLQIAKGLPADLPAAVFVVLHTGAAPSLLPRLLGHVSPLPVEHARDGEPIAHGRVYVAPPDRHLLLKPDGITVVRGPRENNFRPAIDPLFRTAARSFGPRVVGIVLSGLLDDGTHGLGMIKTHGGTAIVQHPEEAAASSMPLSALQHVEVDQILRAGQIAGAIVKLARTPVKKEVGMPTRGRPDVAELGPDAMETGTLTGSPSTFTCPDCGGTLWELQNGHLVRFRCHVGHGFTADALAAAQGTKIEETLWSAMRALEENAQLRRRMSVRTGERGLRELSERLDVDAADATRRADAIRDLLASGTPQMELSVEAARTTAPSATRQKTNGRRRARRR